MSTMTPEQAAALRAPFPEEAIGYKPSIWCGQCREARKQRRHNCDNHARKRCLKCKQNVTDAHTDLAFVGHANVTDRLLSVDPGWDWEPLAYDERGLPARDQDGGLWIRLTVCGTTRIGFGDAEGKQGPNATKELIGDAIRVTAMRFGVGVELWGAAGVAEHAAELTAAHEGDEPTGATQAPAESRPAQRGGARSGGNGNGAQRANQRPKRSAEEPAGLLLGAATQARAEEVAGKVAENGDGALDATPYITQDDRDALGERIDTTATLDDLVTAVLGYWQMHGSGPRQEHRELASAGT